MEVTVLIIDDHPPIIEGYKSILSYNPYGYTLNIQTAFNCESAYQLISTTRNSFDVVMVDYTMPPYPGKKIHCGADLVPVIRKYLPESKIMMLTSHSSSLLLLKLITECDPEGLLVKSDFLADEFLVAFDTIVRGENYFSSTIQSLKKELAEKVEVLDSYNRQIITLLSEGIKTKNLPDHLHLSKSAIDKRKVFIKEFFNVEKGTDEDILREARKQGLI
ncbi:response regulator transcription factor [Flavobacterium sp. J49]|uniref:response regulator n=1 Tax=Flavobacterium sp. J49 TaxID=2718534 RepID=UPI001594CD03|nr:response regulator [Flavobacterium sp. J49]MBF6641344.1 response regulator transcription factor [Flavobacterium sp. J49]NIC02591.1 response regulator transcription factor [Flavobacterium sp. J49]